MESCQRCSDSGMPCAVSPGEYSFPCRTDPSHRAQCLGMRAPLPDSDASRPWCARLPSARKVQRLTQDLQTSSASRLFRSTHSPACRTAAWSPLFFCLSSRKRTFLSAFPCFLCALETRECIGSPSGSRLCKVPRSAPAATFLPYAASVRSEKPSTGSEEAAAEDCPQ